MLTSLMPQTVVARLTATFPRMARTPSDQTLVPVKLYFRPKLVEVSELPNLTASMDGVVKCRASSVVCWPDGSVRSVTADIYIPGMLEHGDTILVWKLDQPVGKEIDLTRYDADRVGLLTPMRSGAIAVRATLPDLKLSWYSHDGSGCETFVFDRAELLQGSSEYIQDFLSTATISGGRWARLHIRMKRGIPGCEFWIRGGWSNKKDPSPSANLGRIVLEAPFLDVGVFLDFMREKTAGSDGEIFLTDGGNWIDGQSFTTHGFFESKVMPILWQNDASDNGAFGWRMRATPSMTATSSAEAWAESKLFSLVPNDPWQAGIWHPTEPHQAGDHMGFGVNGPASAIFFGAPSAIELMRFSFYQEACRPIWIRDATGLAYSDDTLAALGVMMWDERPHPSGNMLGKERPPNIYTEGMRSKSGLIWWGSDRQHDEDISWNTYLALVDDPMAHDMASDRAEIKMAMLRVNSGNETIDGLDDGRGSRTLGMLCRYYLVNPDPRFKKRIRERVELYFRSLPFSSGGVSKIKVVPQQVYGPTDAAGGLLVPHWRPWEDAIAAQVLTLAYAVTGDSLALGVAGFIAANIVMHGYETQPDGTKRIYTALAFNDGVPLTEAQLKDPAMAKPSSGTAYHLWSAPAAAVCYNTGVVLGNQQPDAIPRIKEVTLEALSIFGGIINSTSNVFVRPGDKYEDSGENSEWVSLELLPPPAWLLS